MLWLLASESLDGCFEGASDVLAFRLRQPEAEIKEALKPLIHKGFFLDASTMLAPCLQVAPESCPETEAETEEIQIQSNLTVAPAPASLDRLMPGDCPHFEILKLWAEILPAMPQHSPDHWNGTRKSHLRARWRESSVIHGWKSNLDGLEYFRRLFTYIRQSEFLTGKAKPFGDKRPFFIELEWLVNPRNWAKVHEGKYHPEEISS